MECCSPPPPPLAPPKNQEKIRLSNFNFFSVGKVPLGPLLGKQNIKAKEVYTFKRSIDTLQSTFVSC